jgi:hypothetical protein
MAAIIDHFLKCKENLKHLLIQQNVIAERDAIAGFPYLLNMGACYPEAWKEKENAFWPVDFPTEDEIYWSSAHSSNEDPAICISKLLPHVEFSYETFYEAEWDGQCFLMDGVFSKEPAVKETVEAPMESE